jgi:hypothetical protein
MPSSRFVERCVDDLARVGLYVILLCASHTGKNREEARLWPHNDN